MLVARVVRDVYVFAQRNTVVVCHRRFVITMHLVQIEFETAAASHGMARLLGLCLIQKRVKGLYPGHSNLRCNQGDCNDQRRLDI